MDWHLWFQRWEEYMGSVVPNREERNNAVLDLLSTTMSDSFTLLDLGCGPGSLSKRVLEGFPKARCVAVDFDPVFLAMGKEVLSDHKDRITWIDINLLVPEWTELLESSSVDVVASTSAFHNLYPVQIVSLYRQLGEIIRPGGWFLNCDLLPFPSNMTTFSKIATEASQRNRDHRMSQIGLDLRDGWYGALRRAEPELKDLFEERDRRHSQWSTPGRIDTSLELHLAALNQAGFQESGVVWQYLNHYVILAVR